MKNLMRNKTPYRKTHVTNRYHTYNGSSTANLTQNMRSEACLQKTYIVICIFMVFFFLFLSWYYFSLFCGFGSHCSLSALQTQGKEQLRPSVKYLFFVFFAIKQSLEHHKVVNDKYFHFWVNYPLTTKT